MPVFRFLYVVTLCEEYQPKVLVTGLDDLERTIVNEDSWG